MTKKKNQVNKQNSKGNIDETREPKSNWMS